MEGQRTRFSKNFFGLAVPNKRRILRLYSKITPREACKHSRALLETLAIIAYRQPVTRADIEAVRGVSVSSQIVRNLEEKGWIESVGRKDVLGRPLLYATTKIFLADLGLQSLKELPVISQNEGLNKEGSEPANLI